MKKRKLLICGSVVLILFLGLQNCSQSPKVINRFIGDEECVAKADSLESYKTLLEEAKKIISEYLVREL